MDLPRKLLFLTLALPLCTAYAEAPPRDLFALSLEELTHIKITGSTLTGETLKSVPSSVSVYSHEQIAALGIDRLELEEERFCAARWRAGDKAVCGGASQVGRVS